MDPNRAIVPEAVPDASLVPTNPAVQNTATALGWRSTTLVSRVQRALSSPLEQSLYVLTCAEWEPMHPETFAKILHYFIFGQEYDSNTENLNKLSEILLHDEGLGLGDFLDQCFSLLGKTSDSDPVPLSALTVARLVTAYGEESEAIIDLIETNLDELIEAAGWKTSRGMPTPRAIAKIADIIAAHAAEGSHRGGMPNVITLDEACSLLSKFPYSVLTEEDE